MKYLPVACAVILATSVIAKAEDAIEFGEVKTRFQVEEELAAKELVARQRLQPWEVDWRNTYAWQHGRSRRTEFAPPGCYIRRWVVTPAGAQWQELFIC